MKFLVIFSFLLASGFFYSAVQADSLFGQNYVQGKVKAYSFGKDIRVRILSQESQYAKATTFEYCDQYGQESLSRQKIVQTLKKAMTQGQSIRVAYKSLFDRCIHKISLAE